eukprot:scaffold61447_cov59-Phaeocystis_antarctica.AAC.2
MPASPVARYGKTGAQFPAASLPNPTLTLTLALTLTRHAHLGHAGRGGLCRVRTHPGRAARPAGSGGSGVAARNRALARWRRACGGGGGGGDVAGSAAQEDARSARARAARGAGDVRLAAGGGVGRWKGAAG